MKLLSICLLSLAACGAQKQELSERAQMAYHYTTKEPEACVKLGEINLHRRDIYIDYGNNNAVLYVPFDGAPVFTYSDASTGPSGWRETFENGEYSVGEICSFKVQNGRVTEVLE